MWVSIIVALNGEMVIGMSGKSMAVEKENEQRILRYFSEKYWWWPLVGCVIAAAVYGAGNDSVSNTPLSVIPGICALSAFIAYLLPVGLWVDKKWSKARLSSVLLMSSLLLCGSGWGVVIGVKNATVVESIFTTWVYGVTIPLLISTFMAVFASIYCASVTARPFSVTN